MDANISKLEASYQEGVSHLQNGEPALAREVFSGLLEALPTHPHVLERLGFCFILEEDWSGAETYLIKARKLASEDIDILNNLGCVFQKQGKWQAAYDCFRKVVGLDRRNINGLKNLSLTLVKLGREEAAIDQLRQVLNYFPDEHECRYQLADFLFQHQQYSEASEHFSYLLENNKQDVRASLKLAATQFAMGLEEEGKTLFLTVKSGNATAEKALAEWGNSFQSRKSYGAAVHIYGLLTSVAPENYSFRVSYITNLYLGEEESGIVCALEDAIKVFPEAVNFPRTLMLIHLQAGEEEKAYAAAEQLLGVSEGNSICHMYFAAGVAGCKRFLGKKKSVELAVLHFSQAINLAGGDQKILSMVGELIFECNCKEIIRGVCDHIGNEFESYDFTHLLRGLLNKEELRFELARESFLRSCEIAPDNISALRELADSELRSSNFESALKIGKKVVDLKPGNTAICAYYSSLAYACGQKEESFEIALGAYQANPKDPSTRITMGTQYLLRGEWAKGWPLYEARYESIQDRPFDIPPVPRWDGCEDGNVELIVKCEQGFGDSIQFGRFIEEASRRVKKVYFVTEPKLKWLFMGLNSERVQVLKYGDDFHVCSDQACWASVMDLAWLMGLHEPDFARNVTYLKNRFDAPEQQFVQLDASKFNVGIVWQGNPYQRLDIGRSIPLREFGPLFSVEGANFISLQKYHGTEQLSQAGFKDLIVVPDDEFDQGENAFQDSASLIAALDLIICSDTAMAHLAGSLGCEVWLALKYSPEWRWQLNRTDSPWYPTMTLYRQHKPGDWSGVFAGMVRDLGERVSPIRIRAS